MGSIFADFEGFVIRSMHRLYVHQKEDMFVKIIAMKLNIRKDEIGREKKRRRIQENRTSLLPEPVLSFFPRGNWLFIKKQFFHFMP